MTEKINSKKDVAREAVLALKQFADGKKSSK